MGRPTTNQRLCSIAARLVFCQQAARYTSDPPRIPDRIRVVFGNLGYCIRVAFPQLGSATIRSDDAREVLDNSGHKYCHVLNKI